MRTVHVIHNFIKCSIARAMGFNRVQVGKFFDNLKTIMETKKFPPHRIFNMDESGISTVPNKVSKVVTTTGKKCVNKVVSAERGVSSTIVCCMSASGIFVPPGLIFARKRKNPDLYINAPVGTLDMISDNGYMTTDLFEKWLIHFQTHVRACEDNPVLLIMDNHPTHVNLHGIEYCKKSHISLLTLPPHTSHKLQPLDRAFYSPFKSKFSKVVDCWQVSHPGEAIAPSNMAALFREAYGAVTDTQKGEEGFKITGIWPYNPDVFKDEDFAPSTVTDEFQNQDDDAVLAVPLPSPDDGDGPYYSDDDYALWTASTDEHQNGDINDSVSPINQDNDEVSPTSLPSPRSFISKIPPTPIPSTSAKIHIISPRSIQPLPRRNKKMEKRTREAVASTLLTASPYIKKKNEERNEKEKIMKAKEDRKKVREQKAKEKVENAKKTAEGKAVKAKTKKKNKKPAAKKENRELRKRNVSKKLFADEKDESDEEQLLDFYDSDDDEGNSCLFCNELYKNSRRNENWIQCTEPSCKKWAHVACAGVDENDQFYVCDLCVE